MVSWVTLPLQARNYWLYVDPIAILLKNSERFPIVVRLEADFYQYSAMGGSPDVKNDACFFYVEDGQQRHWLKFDRGHGYSAHFKQGVEYMLEASDFLGICAALRDDIHNYAASVMADEEKIGPLFGAIDAFAKGVSR